MKDKKLHLILLMTVVLGFASCKKGEFGKGIQDVSPTSQQLETQNLGLSNWMMAIPDEKNISQLSIPGTHNSAARIDVKLTENTSRCQGLTISEQLDIGVRFLDIRCRHIDQSFAIHHGQVYQKLNFNDILASCYDFLQRNPSETIIMSVKEEHDSDNNKGETFQTRFETYIQKTIEKWDLNPQISTLGSMRGKIKLLRRFKANKTLGIDATEWKDRETFEINNAANLKIQDKYLVSSGRDKWTSVQTLLKEANNDLSNRLYINFGSGHSTKDILWFTVSSYSRAGSDYVNPEIEKMFDGNLYGKYGIIPLDFIDKTLSEKIVKTNKFFQSGSKYNNDWNYNLKYTSSGNHNQSYDIWLPANRNKNKTSLVVFVHGGSFIGGDKSHNEYIASVDAIKEQCPDCAVATINYRVDLTTKMYEHIEDVNNALKEITAKSEEMNISGSQIVLVGESAGAYLAFVEGFRNPDKYKAIVSLSGFAEMLPEGTVWGNLLVAKLPYGPKFDRYEYSPLDWIPNLDKIPEVYLFCGSKDDMINPNSSERILNALVKKPNVIAFKKLFEGQGHTMSKDTKKEIARILKQKIVF